MDDIADSYTIERIEQMRALADQLRVRIIELLSRRPMTVAQLSDQLQLAHAKVHYHVRELEQVGLVHLVETREKGGILEKYYRPVAKTISISPNLLSSGAHDEAIEMAARFLSQLTAGFMRALDRTTSQPVDEQRGVGLSASSLFVTRPELDELYRRIAELIEPYGSPRGVEGEREVTFLALAYAEDDAEDHAEDHTEDEPAATERTAAQRNVAPVAPPKLPRPPAPVARQKSPDSLGRRHITVVAGSYTYSRGQLEALAAHGERLDIYALGSVRFADDVPAELAERVIRRARIRGRLDASPEVRAVIEHKRKEE